MKTFLAKNWFITTLVAILVLGTGFVFFMWYAGAEKLFEKEVKADEKQEEVEPGTNIDVTVSKGSEEEENNFIELNEKRDRPIEEVYTEGMSESAIQDAIHQMSHQKVIANKKWGALPITMERINRLIEVVEMNNYTHKQDYLEILTAWKNKDFANIDDHHNMIWEKQGGTVGKATGVMSIAEEKEFIENHFGSELE
ncbi:hypothetical protein IMZ31_11595 [Pontibacillus sp. ALD_SL1]|uniref:DUF6241 domain-containing protein n=1 Tax=Pontibacillus sp. ALD_SL1 TaxID=2777185 RepID=UPI001A959EEC|nr:DUF6241 domain-containing protein [Pontibacillus sp. ALD_SL1]QSS98750.1 hypothetical protein IMZ31_11595 [Pontibacillus sp. ALD_SL1]